MPPYGETLCLGYRVYNQEGKLVADSQAEYPDVLDAMCEAILAIKVDKMTVIKRGNSYDDHCKVKGTYEFSIDSDFVKKLNEKFDYDQDRMKKFLEEFLDQFIQKRTLDHSLEPQKFLEEFLAKEQRKYIGTGTRRRRRT